MWEADDLVLLRTSLALLGLAAAAAWERRRSFRLHDGPRLSREARNLGLWGLNSGLIALVPAMAGVVTAGWVQLGGVGLLQHVAAPLFVEVVVAVLGLDLLAYALHRAYHQSEVLWRIHRVHHSDERLSVTTGVRFHVFEVGLSAAARLPVIVALGAGPLAVAIFESLLLLASQLQHADVRIADGPDALLRRLLVTPNLHRIHHSRERIEADSNFGTLLTLWDRLFGSLRIDPTPEQVRVGLPGGAPGSEPSFLELLRMPLRRPALGPGARRTPATTGP